MTRGVILVLGSSLSAAGGGIDVTNYTADLRLRLSTWWGDGCPQRWGVGPACDVAAYPQKGSRVVTILGVSATGAPHVSAASVRQRQANVSNEGSTAVAIYDVVVGAADHARPAESEQGLLRRAWTWRLFHERRDLWVGVFWDRRGEDLHVYICPLPTIVVHGRRR